MPTEKPGFQTQSLIEAALMFMRCPEGLTCKWRRNHCTFVFPDCTEEDIQYARNAQTTVIARDFNHALVQVKSAMYASKHD